MADVGVEGMVSRNSIDFEKLAKMKINLLGQPKVTLSLSNLRYVSKFQNANHEAQALELS